MVDAALVAQVTPTRVLADACGSDPSWICQTVFEASDSEDVARTVDFLVARPLKIVLILLLAWIGNRLVHRAIGRFVRGLGVTDRAAQRAQTLGYVLGSVSTAVIWGLAGLVVLGTFGIALGPLIAGAGIVGVAFGFGAQTLVRDFLSGMFMLIEDQFGVGDVVDVGEAKGTVEALSLRTTRLRDEDGTVWHVPNGEIKRVANKSQR